MSRGHTLVSLGALALSATIASAAARQDRAGATGATREPVVGLLNIPDLVGTGCGQAAPSSRDVFDAPGDPAPSGALRFEVQNRSSDGGACDAARLVLHPHGTQPDLPVPSEESDYEVPALIVHARSGEWFRVALSGGSGWVRAAAGDFLGYPELLVTRLAYIRKPWSAQLWSEPGGVARGVPAEWRAHLTEDLPIEVLAVTRLKSTAWIQVRLLSERCGERLSGVHELSGWIPAYAASGRPAAWFYSRGC